jgi:hypothetical protein
VKFFLSSSETSCSYVLFSVIRLLSGLKSMILCVYPCNMQKDVSLVRKVVGRQVRCGVCMLQMSYVLTFAMYCLHNVHPVVCYKCINNLPTV